MANEELKKMESIDIAKFPMSVFVRTRSDEDIYNELKDNADEDSQTALCKVFGEGAFPYAYMKEASKFICKYIEMAVDKEDSSACNFIYNFINAFMLSGDCDYKDLRNAFYRELMSFVNWYPSESEEILWRAIPDFATRKLIKNPDLADECLCFNLFKGHHWCALLSAQPQFSELAEKYDGFKKLIYYHDEMEDGSWHSGYTEILSYWSNLLQAQPMFREKCKEYNGFADFCSQSPDPLPRESLKCLTTAEPRRIQLVGYDDDELEAHYKGENGWVELLKSTKEFDKEFEEYQAYYSLMEDDWNDLLKARPELAKFKPVERNLEIYPCFDFEDSEHCENDEWNENAVGDYSKVDFSDFVEEVDDDITDSLIHEIEEVYKVENYDNQDVSGICFHYQSLDDSSWVNAKAIGTNFNFASLVNANFENAEIKDAAFGGNRLRGGITKEQLYSTKSYKEGDLTGINFSVNDLTGWDFSNKCLKDSHFEWSILTNVSFKDSDLENVTFDDSNQGSASFENTDFTNANIKGCRLTGATGRGFSKEMLYSTKSYKTKDLENIIFKDCDLSGWNFSGQNLKNASFENCILINTNFKNANLTFANFNNANKADAIF